MAKLEVKENKKLVLKQVLVHELRNFDLEKMDDEIQNFTKRLNVLKAQTFGPLITRNYGTQIHEDGTMSIDYDIMVQAHDYKQYKETYKTYDKLSCEHCAYLHFEDHPQYLNYAYSKLDLYFYENDLESDGVIFNVFLRETPEMVAVDIFRPVKLL